MFIDMRGAEWKEKNQYEQQPTAMRYEDWEFAYSTVVGTREAIKYCLAIGENKIRQQVKLLSSFMRSKLEAVDGIRVLDRGPELSSSVSFYIKEKQPGYIVNEMLKRKINVVASYRAFGLIDFDEKGVNWVVRSSPHYYNTIDEIDYFIEAVKEII
jgi:selenocysteine lyase/cysteine desulfurase